MASTRRTRMRAHRARELQAREVHRRRDTTAHASRVPATDDTALRALAWAATALLLAALMLVILLG